MFFIRDSNALDSSLTPPPGYVVPKFPSLYNPTLELAAARSTDGTVPETAYLYYSIDIYRFTLYWTLILYASTFALCGTWALVVRMMSKRRAPRLFIFVVVAFMLIGTFFAVLGSAIIGYVLAAVYSVGFFSMSTWVPFLWAVIQTLVAVMGSYSTIIAIL